MNRILSIAFAGLAMLSCEKEKRMKMKSLLLVFIGLFTLNSQAQTFEEHLAKGDEFYNTKNYLASAEEYDKAFKMEKGTSIQYYNAACSWALTGDTTFSIQYLLLAANTGWYNLDHLKSDSDLANLHEVAA
jgi:hypothetical protein